MGRNAVYLTHGLLDCKDLIKSILVEDFSKRPSIDTILAHPWLNDVLDAPSSRRTSQTKSRRGSLDTQKSSHSREPSLDAGLKSLLGIQQLHIDTAGSGGSRRGSSPLKTSPIMSVSNAIVLTDPEHAAILQAMEILGFDTQAIIKSVNTGACDALYGLWNLLLARRRSQEIMLATPRTLSMSSILQTSTHNISHSVSEDSFQSRKSSDFGLHGSLKSPLQSPIRESCHGAGGSRRSFALDAMKKSGGDASSNSKKYQRRSHNSGSFKLSELKEVVGQGDPRSSTTTPIDRPRTAPNIPSSSSTRKNGASIVEELGEEAEYT